VLDGAHFSRREILCLAGCMFLAKLTPGFAVAEEAAHMNHDWNKTRNLLVAGSIPAFNAFFKVYPLETIRALGYTWEWGQPDAAFYMVANTQAGIDRALPDINRYGQDDPLTPEQGLDEIRWNAGYFPFPAGLTGPNDEMGKAWEKEADALHALTEAMRPADYNNAEQYALYAKNYEAFHASLVITCCEALAEMAKTGLFGNFEKIDFWVGCTDDNGVIVRDRNIVIRKIIERQHNAGNLR
jgi:hypothetical protein